MSDELDFLLTDDLSAPIPARELSLERGYGLRPYQADAIRSVEDGWGDQEVKAQLICAATGTGKTAIIAILAQRTAEKGGKTLVLAHTDELIDQAIDKIRKFTKVKASKEKAHSYASRFDKMVVGSVQTLSRDMRLLTWPKKHFTTVIVDEAHRSLAASYQKVLQHFLAGGAKIIGVTATADRGDKRSLGEFFQRVAYEYGLLHAVRDGWLVRPIVKTMPLSIDLRGVHSKHTAAGTDFDSQEVGERLVPFMAAIAKQVKEARPSGKIVYFLPSVDTAQRMSDAVNAAGMTCDWVAGISEDRKSTLDRFKSGQLQAVCNCMLLTEGWDHDEVDTLVILRPTKIRSLFCLDSETEILTENGWVGIDGTITGRVASFFLPTGLIEWSPWERIERPIGDDECFYGIENPHLSIRVTDRHNMVVRNRIGGTGRRTNWRLQEAQSVPNAFEIPLCGHQFAPGAPLTDDELRFIGLVMTDGTINKATNGITIYQSERYVDGLSYIRRALDGCGFKYTESIGSGRSNYGERKNPIHRFTISKGAPRGSQKEKSGWGRLVRFIDKELAEPLEDITHEQLLVLLEAMHVGDGTKRAGSTWNPQTYSIATSRRLLADRLQSLCVRRGLRCNIGTNSMGVLMLHISKNAKSTWSIVRHSKDTRPVWGPLAKDCNERVWCVSVKTGAIVTRRHGKVAIVGNCQMAGRACRPLNPIVPLLNAAPNAFERLQLIKNSAKPAYTILDFLWLYEKHDLVRPASLISTKPEVVERMTGKDGDLMDLEEKAERDLLKKLEEEVKKNAKKQAKTIDPLAAAAELGDVDLATYVPETARDATPPSEAQLKILAQNGIKVEEVKYRGQASTLIGRILQRHAKGLCTIRQLHFLNQLGIDGAFMTRDQASAAISRRIKK